MRWGLVLVFLWLLGSCKQISNDKNQLSSSNDSIQIWADSAKNSRQLPYHKRFALVERAYQKNRSLKDNREQVKNLSRISLAYLRLRDSLNFRKSNQELMALARKIGDGVALGEAHWDLGHYFKKNRPDSTFYHYKEALDLFENTDLVRHREYPGRMHLALAGIREDAHDYIGAEKEVIAAIAFFKKIDAKDQLYRGYNALGGIQATFKKYNKALEYHLKAKNYIPYAPAFKRANYYRSNRNNIAGIYLDKGDYAKAHQLFNELEEISRQEDDWDLMLRLGYTSKALSGFKSKLLSAKEAMALIQKSNTALDSMGNVFQKARNQQHLAEILQTEGRTDGAIKVALEAKTIAQTTNNNHRLLKVLKLLSQIDDANAAAHAKAYFDLNERLQLEERAIQDKFARIQLETDEVIEENESLAKRTELLAGVAVGLLVLGIGVFTIISQRVSNQKLRFNQKQQKSNQEIYNLMLAQHGKMEEGKKSEQLRVSQELHDGILGQMLGIRLILSGLNQRNDPSAIEQRAELIVKLQELEEEIRTISHELNAAADEKVHNFILSLKELVSTVKKSTNIAIDFNYDDRFEWDTLKSEVKINCYRIIQELVQNCIKHAKCENIMVFFRMQNNLLVLTVEDDGKGFLKSKAKRGIGLKNIVSRVKKMDAQLTIEPRQPNGTKVSIAIPNIDLKKQYKRPQRLLDKDTLEV